MELRDLTRETEQAKAALTADEFDARTLPLAEEQDDISFRTETVLAQIEELPNASEDFAKEIEIIGLAHDAMLEAFEGLDSSITGPTTIAAETEAIELLLRSRRSGGGGGGGGGASPGGGGGGTDGGAALAMSGRAIGKYDKVEEREASQRQSRTVTKVPVELQDALDRYFDAIEGR